VQGIQAKINSKKIQIGYKEVSRKTNYQHIMNFRNLKILDFFIFINESHIFLLFAVAAVAKGNLLA
jgi:hypothetical protein